MASFLQKSTPWIEDAFVYASSFDTTASVAASVNHNNDDHENGYYDDIDDDDARRPFDSQAEAEPQTENTIPSGLLPSPDETGEGGVGTFGTTRKPPPSRRSRIVQVMRRGGDFGHYAKNENKDDRGGDAASCPPYLILHDGQHSAIAFLSSETVEGFLGDDGGNGTSMNVPPNKSLISISDYTLATIFQCTAHNLEFYSQIIGHLCSDTPLVPHQMQQLIFNQQRSQLLMCLYLQGPIVMIGAENQGTIGTPVDVHCSVQLRRMLMDHERQYLCEGDMEKVGFPHLKLIRLLEACHCHHQMAAKKNGEGFGKSWPWESRLANVADEEAGNCAEVNEIAVPGNVDCLIKQEDAFEDMFGSDLEEFGATEEDHGQCDLGDDFEEAVCDGDSHRIMEAAVVARGEGNGKDNGEGREINFTEGVDKVSQHNVNVMSDDDDTGNRLVGGAVQETVPCNVATSKNGNDDTGRDNDDDDATIPLKECGSHNKQSASYSQKSNNKIAPVKQGNVAELFENFDEIEDVLDLSTSSPSSGEHRAAKEGRGAPSKGEVVNQETSASLAEQQDSASERCDRSDTAGLTAEHGDYGILDSSKAVDRNPFVDRVEPCQGGGNTARNTDEKEIEETVRKNAGHKSQEETRHEAFASFVGIDDMMLDEEEEDGEEGNHPTDSNENGNENSIENSNEQGDERTYTQTDWEKDHDGNENDYAESEEPLFTQPNDDGVVRDDEEGEESQILLSQVENIGRAAATNEGDRKEDRRLNESQMPLAALVATAKRPTGCLRRDWLDKELTEDEGHQSPLSAHCASMRAQGTTGQNVEGNKDHRLESHIPLTTNQGTAKKAPATLAYESEDGQLYSIDGNDTCEPESRHADGCENLRYPQIPLPLPQQKKKPAPVKQRKRRVNREKAFDHVTHVDPPPTQYVLPDKQTTAGDNDICFRGSLSLLDMEQHVAPQKSSLHMTWEFHSDSSDSDNWMRLAYRKKSSKQAKSTGPSDSDNQMKVASKKKDSKRAKRSPGWRPHEKVAPVTAAAARKSTQGKVKRKPKRIESVAEPRRSMDQRITPTGEEKSRASSYRREQRIGDVQGDDPPGRSESKSPRGSGTRNVRFATGDSFDHHRIDVAAITARASAMLGNITTQRSSPFAGDSRDGGGTPQKKRKGNKEIDMVALLAKAKRLCEKL